jgi:hypothetical protein
MSKDWIQISRTPNLNIQFLRENKDDLYWQLVQRNTYLTKEMLIEFQDYIDWHLYHIMLPYYSKDNYEEQN